MRNMRGHCAGSHPSCAVRHSHAPPLHPVFLSPCGPRPVTAPALRLSYTPARGTSWNPGTVQHVVGDVRHYPRVAIPGRARAGGIAVPVMQNAPLLADRSTRAYCRSSLSSSWATAGISHGSLSTSHYAAGGCNEGAVVSQPQYGSSWHPDLCCPCTRELHGYIRANFGHIFPRFCRPPPRPGWKVTFALTPF